jgi:hypothetical protein
VVGKPIHLDDGCRNPLARAISCKVRAWVVEKLVPLVREKGSGSVGQLGIIDVPYGGCGAKKRHNPQDHGGGSSSGGRHVVGEVHDKGISDRPVKREGVITEGGGDGDTFKCRRKGGGGGKRFFLYMIALRASGRKQGQCRPRLGGWHLHGSW